MLNKIWKIIYIIWGVFAYFIIIYGWLLDIIPVFSGSIKIENWLWYTGQIPIIFAVLLLLTKRFRAVRNLTRIFGLLSFLLFSYVQFSTNQLLWRFSLVALFALITALKLGRTDKKTEKTNVEPIS